LCYSKKLQKDLFNPFYFEKRQEINFLLEIKTLDEIVYHKQITIKIGKTRIKNFVDVENKK
jgi:hypothetical protein